MEKPHVHVKRLCTKFFVFHWLIEIFLSKTLILSH